MRSRWKRCWPRRVVRLAFPDPVTSFPDGAGKASGWRCPWTARRRAPPWRRSSTSWQPAISRTRSRKAIASTATSNRCAAARSRPASAPPASSRPATIRRSARSTGSTAMRTRTEASAFLADQQARDAIREDLDSTILVEAAAGTGKTRSLVERMVALVATGKTTVDRLSAVTFTIRAAAQLKQRFQGALEEALREEAHPGRRERLAAALRSIDLCFVGTIHAFAARLLRERPVEAGIEPGFAEMDEPENGAARQEAWNRFTEKLFVRGDPRLARLIDLHVRLNDLTEAFADVCENSDIERAPAERLPEPDFSRSRAAVAQFLKLAAASLPSQAPAGGWTAFQAAVRRALRLFELLDPSRAADFVEILRVLRPSTVGDSAGAWKTAIKRLRNEEVKPSLVRWAEYVYPDVIPLLLEAREEFRRWRRRNG